MVNKFKILLSIIKNQSEFHAHEAAKEITRIKLSNGEVKKLSMIVSEGKDIHNKEAAVYAMSWMENKSITLPLLVDILGNKDIHENIRGRAAEGIGIISPSRKFKIRSKIDKILLNTLNDPSPTVRFWSCYAADMLKLESAIPILKELKEKDDGICPGWWYVSEESEDAIAIIKNLDCEDRIPVDQRS